MRLCTLNMHASDVNVRGILGQNSFKGGRI